MTVIISLTDKVLAQKTSLTPPFLIEVAVPIQETERSCTCVRDFDIDSFSTNFPADVGLFPHFYFRFAFYL